MEVSISVVCPEEEAISRTEKIKEKLGEIKDIEIRVMAEKSKNGKTVIRINIDSKQFNENLEKIKEAITGLPAIARVKTEQSGGGYTNTGFAEATLLTNGEIPRKVAGSHYANGVHAIYYITHGFVGSASYHNKDSPALRGRVYYVAVDLDNGYQEIEIAKISKEDMEATPEIEIIQRPPKISDHRLLEVIAEMTELLYDKCTCYHCREEHSI